MSDLEEKIWRFEGTAIETNQMESQKEKINKQSTLIDLQGNIKLHNIELPQGEVEWKQKYI